MFLISWQGLGFFKAALELHKDGEGPSHLPHNGSSRERALARAMTMKRTGFKWCWRSAKLSITALCEQYYVETRLAAPFRRGVQKGAQASEVQGGPSICQNMGLRHFSVMGTSLIARAHRYEQLVSAQITINNGWLTP